jgi:hypothetical protein
MMPNRKAVKELYHDDDGWWAILKPEYANTAMDNASTVNGETYQQLCEAMKEVKKRKSTHVCTYINSRGDTRVKYFCSETEGLAFCDKLDERIRRGTCGGYSFSRI